jgi:glycosyltransferase involved in cell wall biosynthesis
MAMEPLLTVVVPSYNEGKVVAETVARVLSSNPSNVDEVCVHVILDGPDPLALKSLLELQSRCIKITELTKNSGKGYCLRLGASASNSKYVAFLDADLDLDPVAIWLGLEILEQAVDPDIGCVYGSKFHPNSELKYPFLRKIASKMFRFVVKMLFGLTVDDSQTGLKVFRNSDLKHIINLTRENHFMLDLEIMILLNRRGVKMIPVPVNLNYKFSSTIGLRAVYKLGVQTVGLFLRHFVKLK